MAKNDILPWSSPFGGTTDVHYAPMAASETFQRGEPVGVVNAGTLQEPPDDATEWTIGDQDPGIVGIACEGPGAASAAADPTSKVEINPKTGAAYATNDRIAFWPARPGQKFITSNFFATAAGAAATPAQTDVGEPYQITYATAGTPDLGWGVEQTAAARGTDVVAVVYDVLDSMKRPISESGGTGVYVVFEIEASSTAAP